MDNKGRGINENGCELDGGVCVSHSTEEHCPTEFQKSVLATIGPAGYTAVLARLLREEQDRIMANLKFQVRAISLVYGYVKSVLEKTDKHVTFSADEVYIVWFTYVLGNWKALLSTTLPDGMYYEVAYNAVKGETYIDAYKKWENVVIPDKE